MLPILKLWCFVVERLVGILAGLLVALLVIFVLVMFCETFGGWVGERLGLHTKNPTLKFLGIGIGGVLLALQAIMSYRRAKALEDTVRNAEQGQRQERLKNAIEHLGHASDSVRLGGAYELFHLAEDTAEDKKDLRQTVFDILCVHIRRTTGEKKYRKKHKSQPSKEIQSLLTLLFVQDHEVFKDIHVNLQGSWLKGANLQKSRLRKANLIGAHLQEATLREAELHGANLRDAKLQGATLREAWLNGANLRDAKLRRAYLFEATLREAELHGAHLFEASLRGADLRGATLREAWLYGADMRGAQLQGADFFEARLYGAYLWEAKLNGADMKGARLQGADLFRAWLHGTDLREAQLQGANLYGVQLQGANLCGVQLRGVKCEEDVSHRQEDVSAYIFAGSAPARRDMKKPVTFEEYMNQSVDKESDLSAAIFAGGLSQQDIESSVKGLSDEKSQRTASETESPHRKINKPCATERQRCHYRNLRSKRSYGPDMPIRTHPRRKILSDM